MVITCIALAIAGVFIGILSGLLGIGGGTLMVPMLRLIFGLPALGATSTSLFVIIPTSISGAAAHIRQKTCIPALGAVMGMGGALTSVLGVYLSNISPSYLVMVVAGIVIAYSAFSMLKKANAKSKKAATCDDSCDTKVVEDAEASVDAQTSPSNARTSPTNTSTQTPPRADAQAPSTSTNTQKPISAAHQTPTSHTQPPTLTKKQLAGGLGIGAIAGVISGYVGVGGGFIMVPLMCAWLRMPLKLASGTSLIAILILAIPGVIAQGIFGNVDYIAGVMLAIGSIPGAVIGAKLIKRVPENTLRYVFSALLFIAAVFLIVNEIV